MTITEFLLARIAEDEAAIPEWHARLVAGSPIADWIRHIGDRVLAECAAKRAIVEALIGTDPRHEALSALTLEFVVGQLAAIYADHPDYDTEWAR
jgi:hypothetical protein